jgi:hypothetical protein
MRRTLLLPALLLLSAAPAAAQGTIRPGQSVTGELVQSDPVMGQGVHYDVWRFRGEASHLYRVTLRSGDFDAFLTVGSEAQAGCDDCATDDDGAGGTDALVEYSGSADGLYEIRAYTYEDGEMGSYELTLEDQGIQESHAEEVVAGTPIAAGETVSGELARGDTKTEGQSYSDTWTYQGRAGEIITITVRSEDFDAMLNVGAFDGGECMGMDGDDDSGGGTDSRLTMRLPEDGAYHLHVSSSRPGGAGRYTVLVEPAEEVVAVASPIMAGEAVEGRLMQGDAREPEDGSPYDLWSYRGTAGETLTITLTSRDFDTYLRFGRMVDGAWQQIESNDDFEGSTDSELTVTLPETGEYLIHANTFLIAGQGDYRLLATRQ